MSPTIIHAHENKYIHLYNLNYFSVTTPVLIMTCLPVVSTVAPLGCDWSVDRI